MTPSDRNPPCRLCGQPQQCDEFDRLQAVAAEAAKRIRALLDAVEDDTVDVSQNLDFAMKDAVIIAEKIERREWP